MCWTDRFSDRDAALTRCGSYGTFCCGDDKAAHDCCNGVGNETLGVTATSGEFIDLSPDSDGDPDDESTLPSSTPTQPGPPRTSDTCPTGSSQESQNSSSDSSLKTSRNALIGVTAALGVVTIAAATLAYLWKRKLERMTDVALRLNGIVPPGYRDPSLPVPGGQNGPPMGMGHGP